MALCTRGFVSDPAPNPNIGTFADRVTGELAEGARVLGSGSFAIMRDRSPKKVAFRLPPQELVEFGVFNLTNDGA